MLESRWVPPAPSRQILGALADSACTPPSLSEDPSRTIFGPIAVRRRPLRRPQSKDPAGAHQAREVRTAAAILPSHPALLPRVPSACSPRRQPRPATWAALPAAARRWAQPSWPGAAGATLVLLLLSVAATTHPRAGRPDLAAGRSGSAAATKLPATARVLVQQDAAAGDFDTPLLRPAEGQTVQETAGQQQAEVQVAGSDQPAEEASTQPGFAGRWRRPRCPR